jgi:hypothetical protein
LAGVKGKSGGKREGSGRHKNNRQNFTFRIDKEIKSQIESYYYPGTAADKYNMLLEKGLFWLSRGM